MTTHRLLDHDGHLLPVWGFLTFHDAVRRDVARLHAATEARAAVAWDGNVHAALATRWARLAALLAFHHRAEDEMLFVAVRDLRPDLGTTIDGLVADHHRLDELVARIDGLVARLDTAEGSAEAPTAFAELQVLLDPHLATEEDELLPPFLARIREQLAAGGEPPPGPDFDELPVPVEFVVPWTVEHLDDEILAQALDPYLAALGEEQRARFPAWLDAYRTEQARWLAEPANARGG